MFEGKRPVPAPESRHRSDRAAAHAMRELNWPDLVARLAAAHDLRMIIGTRDEEAGASFDAGSARRIAQLNLHSQADGEQAVNLEGSANGKWDPAIVCRHSSEPLPASRGSE